MLQFSFLIECSCFLEENFLKEDFLDEGFLEETFLEEEVEALVSLIFHFDPVPEHKKVLIRFLSIRKF